MLTMLSNILPLPLAILATTFSATCVEAQDPWCCSGGVSPQTNCTGLNQRECEFHLPQCAWGPSKDCPPEPDPWCCSGSGGVSPQVNCTGLNQRDCEFHLPQCAWGPSKKCPRNEAIATHAGRVSATSLLGSSSSASAMTINPPSFPTSFSLVAAPDGYFTEAHMDGNAKTFSLKKTGGSQDKQAFEAIFCNATGLYTFFSAQAGMCYYQQSKTCNDLSFRNAVAFLTFAKDDTLSLLMNGISLEAVPHSLSNGTIVWSERTPTCSNESFLYVNVTLSAENALLAWSRGSSVINPLDRSCKVTNRGRTFTKFVPTSTITNEIVEAFVSRRVAAEGLNCLSGP